MLRQTGMGLPTGPATKPLLLAQMAKAIEPP